MTKEKSWLRNAWYSHLLVVGVLGLAACGCENAKGALTKVGLADPATAPPEMIDVVCDPSVGSTCTVESLSETLMVIFERAAAQPGSFVRLWMLGATVESTEVKAHVMSAPLTGKTARARAAEVARWQAQERDMFVARVTSTLTAKRRPASSPLAETITKVALADGKGLHRKLVLISDGREMGVADFECGPLPSDASWPARLKQLGLLAPGSLAGIDVSFTYLAMPPIDRCAVSLKRELRIRELWKSALVATGASEVRIYSGPVTWEERTAVQTTEAGK